MRKATFFFCTVLLTLSSAVLAGSKTYDVVIKSGDIYDGSGRASYAADVGIKDGYITAVGLYKLFISQQEEQLLKRIKIESLVDLESKIIGVVVAALAVSFLGSAVEAPEPLSVFHTGIGIALVIGALCLFTKVTGSPEK